jgi:hypothetical protein
MGSQIFDYWFDKSGFILEHYVDGDLVNDETPTNRSQASPDNLHVWGTYFTMTMKRSSLTFTGPDLPPTFLL